MKVKTVSKSKLVEYEKCPLKAYLALRDTEHREQNEDMLYGTLMHELAMERISRHYDTVEKFVSFEPEKRYPPEIFVKAREAIEKSSIETIYSGLQILGFEISISIEMPDIREGLFLTARPDVISMFINDNGEKVIVVDDLKSGFNVSKNLDIEAMVYAYAASKKYGDVPVIFRRPSIVSKTSYTKEFTPSLISTIEQTLKFLIQRYVADMESEEKPEYQPGNHCLSCSYIRQCNAGRKKLNSLHHKFKASVYAKALAKKYETEVKSAAKEIASKKGAIPNDQSESVLIPFLNNRYGAVVTESESYSLGTRKVSRGDIIKLLIESGDISKFVHLLDIKIDKELAEYIDSLGVKVNKKVTQRISLVEERVPEEEEE